MFEYKTLLLCYTVLLSEMCHVSTVGEKKKFFIASRNQVIMDKGNVKQLSLLWTCPNFLRAFRVKISHNSAQLQSSVNWKLCNYLHRRSRATSRN